MIVAGPDYRLFRNKLNGVSSHMGGNTPDTKKVRLSGGNKFRRAPFN